MQELCHPLPMKRHEKGLCPCCSGRIYGECCAPCFKGMHPLTAEALMRSRYTAYASGFVDYILETTYGSPPDTQQVLDFCEHTQFIKLEVLCSKEVGLTATVVFIAHLKQHQQSITFTERSAFLKENGRWLYISGETFFGENRSLSC